MSIHQRHLQPERMDDPGLDTTAHRRALAGLGRINAWSRTTSRLCHALQAICRDRNLSRPRILDIACGGGDITRRLARHTAAHDLGWQLAGCDISDTAVEHSTAAAESERLENCTYFTHNALEQPLPDGFDVVMCTLFLHHLENEQVVRLLKRMSEGAQHAVLADDLVRSNRGYWLAHIGCRLLSRSPIVHFDGPASVRAAFTLAEAQHLATTAGLRTARFTTHWPLRYLMEWRQAA